MYLGSTALSAMNAFSVDMQVRANNIANVNTPGFKAQDITLVTGPQGEGVRVGLVSRDTSPGPLVPSLISVSDDGREAYAPGYVEGSNTDIAREFVNMIATQRAYEANAAVVRTADTIAGAVVDMVV